VSQIARLRITQNELGGPAVVELDGRDISQIVSQVKLDMSAMEPATIALHVYPDHVEIDVPALLSIYGEVDIDAVNYPPPRLSK
jgi:hypothetical protein